MKEPTFDQYGYPTEETLRAISEWDSHDLSGLFAFIRQAWEYSEYWQEKPDGVHIIHTCGWSGNESLISAFQENRLAWILCWVQSRRGGHYVFQIPAYQLATQPPDGTDGGAEGKEQEE